MTSANCDQSKSIDHSLIEDVKKVQAELELFRQEIEKVDNEVKKVKIETENTAKEIDSLMKSNLCASNNCKYVCIYYVDEDGENVEYGTLKTARHKYGIKITKCDIPKEIDDRLDNVDGICGILAYGTFINKDVSKSQYNPKVSFNRYYDGDVMYIRCTKIPNKDYDSDDYHDD